VLAHCVDAESLISFSIIPASFFSPHVFSEPGQNLQTALLINHLTLRYPFNHDYASNIEENDHHCLHLRLAHSCCFSFLVKGAFFNASIASSFPDCNEQLIFNFTRNFRLMHYLISSLSRIW
jgi:hypothetical protein